ncbi:hypothetical protein Tco_0836995 [Tanacetum coccineum]
MESHASNDMGHNIIIKVDKKVKEGLNSFETVIEEDELRDIKRNGPDDKTCGETKEVEEVEVKSKVSGEEIEEETKEEEEDDPNLNEKRRPTRQSGLVYDKEKGTIMFEMNNEKITFKMPHKMERFSHIDFEGNFTYECDFVVLEDTTSVIDHYLGEVVFGKPFIRTNGLVYDKEKGTIMFEMNNEKITFKMPHKMERFSHIDFEGIKTDSIPPFVLENDNDHEKTYYSDSLILRPEYKQDESVSKEIQHLMKLKSRTKDEGGVTLNEDILKITVLTTNTPYPSRKIRRICACTHQRPRKQDPIRRIQERQYAVFKLYGNKIFWKISNVVPTPRNPQYAVSKTLDTPSSTKELFTPFKDPKQEFQSSRKHFKTLSLDESRSPDFDLFSDQEEYSEEEVAETMAETMEQYMSKTRADYGSGVARSKIEDKDNFELKGQFLKELRTNTFSGSDHEDANEHIEKVLEIVDLFHNLILL